MDLREKDIGDVRVICLSGALTAENADPLRAAVTRSLPGPGRIVLDLADLRNIDRAGVGVLAELRDQAKRSGGVLKLACLQILPRSIFNMMNVYSLFDVYDTIPAALESFCR